MKDSAISFIRVISMLFIIICHLAFYHSSVVGQLFNVGVPIFLFISGFLYGKKDINTWLNWSKKRWISLMIPCYIWIILLVIMGMLTPVEVINEKSCCLVLFNLQGISFLVSSANWAQMSGGLGHLWFLTALMLCYTCIPILQKVQPWILTRNKIEIIILILSAISLKILCAYTVGINLEYLLIFSIGYFWSKKWRLPSSRAILIFFILAIISSILRAGAFTLWKDTILYHTIILRISHTILAICIFQILYWLHNQTRKAIPCIEMQGATSRYIDKLTFYIYITHYIFLTGAFSVRQYAENSVTLQLLLFSGLTIGSAILLERLSCYPIKWLTRKKS